MSADAKQNGEASRRLRLGMVGGGPGAFIGAVHRIAARLDDRYELVAAVLSSNPARSRSAAQDLHISPDRAYGSYTEMAATEAKRPDRITLEIKQERREQARWWKKLRTEGQETIL